MLSVSTYPQVHVDACRSCIDAQVGAYDTVVARAAGTGLDDALATFTPEFFNGLVLQLDHAFVHRARGKEGKDGNPLNEVRLLSTSLQEHGGTLAADKSIRLEAATSVVGLEAGDEIRLGREQFLGLADAYFASIVERFT